MADTSEIVELTGGHTLPPIPAPVDVPKVGRPIISDRFHDALVAAGVVRTGERIRRIVIDAKVGEAVVMHIERYGDTRLLDVVTSTVGIEVHEERPADD